LSLLSARPVSELGVNVKYRNNSSLLISGNDRSCSYCSRENIFSDTQPLPGGSSCL